MSQQMDYDPYNPLPDQAPKYEKQGVEWYIKAELAAMDGPSFPDNRQEVDWRQRAVIVIFNVSRQEHLEPLTSYLAMNIFDRYLTKEKRIPKVMKYPQHDLELLSICSLTLACKTRNQNFSPRRFLEENQELRVVTKREFLTMELSIRKGLDWRLRSVTPFCFVPLFEPYFNSPHGFSRRTINEIIIQSQDDFWMPGYRPSAIAAGALLAASSFLYPEMCDSFFNKLNSEILLNQMEVKNCTDKLIDRCKDLRILIESAATPENEYLPRLRIRAGETSDPTAAETSDRGTSEQEASTSQQMAATERSNEAAKKSTERSITKGESSNASTSSQRPSIGQEKAVEMTEMPRMAENSADMEFNFVLRWPVGEEYADGFVIFTNMEQPEAPAVVNEDPQSGPDNPQGCCNCDSCFNCCSIM